MTTVSAKAPKEKGISVRTMRETDLDTVRRIFRIAFATFVNAPDKENFYADRECVSTRWRADSEAAIVAERTGEIAGSNFVTSWGSFGFFGPLTIKPELWDRGIAQQLLARTVEIFEERGIRDSGLFTFPHSTKHVNLYQKFGYWPGFLTSVMVKPVEPVKSAWIGYSTLGDDRKADARRACREMTDSIHAGLDVTSEIEAVASQSLGETVLLWEGDRLEGFAVCFCGQGTEGGKGGCYAKFAAALPGEERFRHLLGGIEAMAGARGLLKIEAGVNTSRSQAYRTMLDAGFRAQTQGVAMTRNNEPVFNRRNVFVIDDWR
jgi:ribosomal protein S18 acetylase RimI-like enzyme